MNLITSSSECGRQRREKLVGSDKSCAYLKSSETEERRDSLWNHCEPNTGSSFPLCSAGAQSKAAVNGLCSRQVLKESIQRRRYFTSPLVFLWWAKKKIPLSSRCLLSFGWSPLFHPYLPIHRPEEWTSSSLTHAGVRRRPPSVRRGHEGQSGDQLVSKATRSAAPAAT